MIFKTITYRFTKNLGSANSECLEVTAELDHTDDIDETIEMLKLAVHQALEIEPRTERTEHSPF